MNAPATLDGPASELVSHEAGRPRPRATNIDRHVGAKMRECRLRLGMSLQEVADMIGVTYQQAHKYEHGRNRIAVGRLHQIAQALGVEVDYFFPDTAGDQAFQLTEQQQRVLELARLFVAIPSRGQQEVLCTLARVLAEADQAKAGRQAA